MAVRNSSSAIDFKKEEAMLLSLQRDIENTDSIEANTVAYLSSRIQEIRASLRDKDVSVRNLKKSSKAEEKTKLEFKKPFSSNLAEQKKKEYYF